MAGWLTNNDPHGMKIVVDGNTYHTWRDLRLIANGRLVINPPPLKSNYLAIAGKNGQIDMTETLTGFPLYDNRTGSLEFIIDNQVVNPSQMGRIDYMSWADRYSEIMNLFNGKSVKIILDDDPDFEYVGRVTVNSWGQGQSWSTISFDYALDPYKYDRDYYRLTLEAGSGGSMNVTLKYSGSDDYIYEDEPVSEAFDLKPYLDYMPIIATSSAKNPLSDLNLNVTIRNTQLAFNKTVNLTKPSGGILTNPYGLRSFVMTKGTMSSHCDIFVEGAGSLTMTWTNGRM